MLNVVKKKKKEKGIALTHHAQGGPANGRAASLLMKADLKPEDVTEDVVKQLGQVMVNLSMEEFLRRFFGLWDTDAEILTKLLGFDTELDTKLSQGDLDDDAWEKQWAEAHQDYIEDRLEQFTIMKSAAQGENLKPYDQYQVLKVQQVFEKAVEENNITFEFVDLDEEAELNKTAEEVKPEPQVLKVNPSKVTKALDKVEKANDEQETTKSQQEKDVTDTVDVTKSAEYLDLQTKLADLEKASKEKDDLIKAAQAVLAEKEKEEFISKASTAGFADEAEQATLVELMMKSKDSVPVIMSVIEKANIKIAELEKSVADKDAEIIEVKKAFGEKEHGSESKPVVSSAKQDIINQKAALLKAAKEKENK